MYMYVCTLAAPGSGCLSTITSQYPSIIRIESVFWGKDHLTHYSTNVNLVFHYYYLPARDSPFITDELSFVKETTPPPRRCMAAWKEQDVRVLTS